MSQRTYYVLFAILALLIAAMLANWYLEGTLRTVGVTPSDVEHDDRMPPETHTIAGGALSFSRPDDFGLAVAAHQVLVDTAIPPCAPGFDYCLYYNGKAYEGTTFESAGLALRTREDLTSLEACVTTPPAGYADLTPVTAVESGYAAGAFEEIGDAGAGRYTNGAEYRFFIDGSCYQLTTQVGESQIGNYPSGSVDVFTEEERGALLARLRGMVESFVLTETGERLSLPTHSE